MCFWYDFDAVQWLHLYAIVCMRFPKRVQLDFVSLSLNILSTIYATDTVVVRVTTFVTTVLYSRYFKYASYPYAHIATNPKNWKGKQTNRNWDKNDRFLPVNVFKYDWTLTFRFNCELKHLSNIFIRMSWFPMYFCAIERKNTHASSCKKSNSFGNYKWRW